MVLRSWRRQQIGFQEPLSKELIVQLMAILGPCATLVKPPHGGGRERTDYEADPRHAELIIPSCIVSAPSEKSNLGVDHSTGLNNNDYTLHRSATWRLRLRSFHQQNLRDGGTHKSHPTTRLDMDVRCESFVDKLKNRFASWCSKTQIMLVV